MDTNQKITELLSYYSAEEIAERLRDITRHLVRDCHELDRAYLSDTMLMIELIIDTLYQPPAPSQWPTAKS